MKTPGRARIVDNPFYVLDLRPEATRAEIERQGHKWLGMLELGLDSARRYATPLGACERDAGKVRSAVAELRDPERRLLAELWARLETAPPAGEDDDQALPASPPGGYPDALAELGFGPQRSRG